MVDWQVTASTIYCDAVDDQVTIMVYKDWTTKCAAYKKYGESIAKDTAKVLKKRGKKLNRELRCEGPECSRVTGYKDKVFAEAGKTR
jgi:hypothetical protein